MLRESLFFVGSLFLWWGSALEALLLKRISRSGPGSTAAKPRGGMLRFLSPRFLLLAARESGSPVASLEACTRVRLSLEPALEIDPRPDAASFLSARLLALRPVQCSGRPGRFFPAAANVGEDSSRRTLG